MKCQVENCDQQAVISEVLLFVFGDGQHTIETAHAVPLCLDHSITNLRNNDGWQIARIQRIQGTV